MIKECSSTLVEGTLIDIPHLKEAVVLYECKAIHTVDINHAVLDESIVKRYYPQGDFHRVY